jgi:GNAT superfamily N-acetyltransferase
MALEIPLLVRPISAQDEAQWRDLWRGYLAFYVTDLPEDTYRETFGRIVKGDAGMAGFIAVSDGRAVGLTHYLYHMNFWKPGKTCYLQDLFTTPQARGKGVARALMEAVFAAAAKLGIPDVYWLTAETNYAGRMLYDRVGVKTPFIVYERVA